MLFLQREEDHRNECISKEVSKAAIKRKRASIESLCQL
jgi:hypothetical protein